MKLVDTREAVITIGAMGTHKAIAKAIIDGGAPYVLALNGNQEKLHDAVIAYIDEQKLTDFTKTNVRRHITKDNCHDRDETQHYIQMPAPKTLPGFELWQGLLTIGIAMLSCVRDGKEAAEICCFISSLPLGVQRFAHAVRSHWGIENTCHRRLDVTYREDDSRIRHKLLCENFVWISRFT